VWRRQVEVSAKLLEFEGAVCNTNESSKNKIEKSENK